jgi:hypothetical protein
MSLLMSNSANASLSEMQARYAAYRQEILAAGHRMPRNAFEFASAEWHYDFSDPRCPHDAWVDSIDIREPATGERHEVRRLEIRVDLLGAYHDGHIRLTYPGVRQYSLFQPRGATGGSAASHGHGDWMVDEVSVSANSRPERLLVVHEIAFARGGTWTIESEDILYEWRPL